MSASGTVSTEKKILDLPCFNKSKLKYYSFCWCRIHMFWHVGSDEMWKHVCSCCCDSYNVFQFKCNVLLLQSSGKNKKHAASFWSNLNTFLSVSICGSYIRVYLSSLPFSKPAGHKQNETLPPPLRPQHAESSRHNDMAKARCTPAAPQ